jgi:hypothetical protein
LRHLRMCMHARTSAHTVQWEAVGGGGMHAHSRGDRGQLHTHTRTGFVDSSKFACPVASLCACASCTFLNKVSQSLHSNERAIACH